MPNLSRAVLSSRKSSQVNHELFLSAHEKHCRTWCVLSIVDDRRRPLPKVACYSEKRLGSLGNRHTQQQHTPTNKNNNLQNHFNLSPPTCRLSISSTVRAPLPLSSRGASSSTSTSELDSIIGLDDISTVMSCHSRRVAQKELFGVFLVF